MFPKYRRAHAEASDHTENAWQSSPHVIMNFWNSMVLFFIFPRNVLSKGLGPFLKRTVPAIGFYVLPEETMRTTTGMK